MTIAVRVRVLFSPRKRIDQPGHDFATSRSFGHRPGFSPLLDVFFHLLSATIKHPIQRFRANRPHDDGQIAPPPPVSSPHGGALVPFKQGGPRSQREQSQDVKQGPRTPWQGGLEPWSCAS